MQISVRTLLGETICLDLSPEMLASPKLGLKMKEQIAEKTTIPVENQRLIMAGTNIKNYWNKADIVRETGYFSDDTSMHLFFSVSDAVEEAFSIAEAAKMPWASVRVCISEDCRSTLADLTQPDRKPKGVKSVDMETYWNGLEERDRVLLLNHKDIVPYFEGISMEDKAELHMRKVRGLTDPLSQQLALANEYLLEKDSYSRIRDNPVFADYLAAYQRVSYPQKITSITRQYHYHSEVQQVLGETLRQHPDLTFPRAKMERVATLIDERRAASVLLSPGSSSFYAHATPSASLTDSSVLGFNNAPRAIGDLLRSFYNKIINTPMVSSKATQKAWDLYYRLDSEIKAVFSDQQGIKPNTLRHLANIIKNEVEGAAPILQKNLGWGDYISNLGKKICNILITGANMLCSFEKYRIKQADLLQYANDFKSKANAALGEMCPAEEACDYSLMRAAQ